MADSRRPLLALAAVLMAAAASPALAWEDVGHRWIGTLGIQALPASLPAFLRTPEAARDIGEWAREPDRSRGAGRTHDADRDPGHFADVDDAGKLLGGPTPDHMPVTREDYEKRLQAAGTDGWKAGYLHYNLVEGWQQLVKDFAYWRADAYGEKAAKDPAHKAWLKEGPHPARNTADLRAGFLGPFRWRRQPAAAHDLPLQRLGPLSEPQGLHHRTDSRAVRGRLRQPQPDDGGGEGGYASGGRLRPMRHSRPCFDAYPCTNTHQYVETVYQMWKDGELKDGNAKGTAFVTARVADGAAELRDMVTFGLERLGRDGRWVPA